MVMFHVLVPSIHVIQVVFFQKIYIPFPLSEGFGLNHSHSSGFL